MIWIIDLAVPYNLNITLFDMVSERLKIPKAKIKNVKIVKLALDARKYRSQQLRRIYTLEVSLLGNKKLEDKILHKFARDVKIKKAPPKSKSVFSLAKEEVQAKKPPIKYQQKFTRPIVVGFGPSGIFAALFLSLRGFSPLILERGAEIFLRKKAVDDFLKHGILDENTNVQFGEGGAGTFSDGKLTVRKTDPLINDILDIFIEAGAPKEIAYLHNPHIGTDLLRKVILNIRKKILSLGGEIRFLTKVTDFEIKNGNIDALIVNGEERIPVHTVFLGIGHSARDTYEMLLKRQIFMEPKAFAIGLRIEHQQALIDANQYHGLKEHLPPASYTLTYRDKETGRNCYSFCMCPGGYVIAGASEKNHLVINGMSMHQRDSGIANSALVVPVYTSDFLESVQGAINFQRKYEEKAFKIGKNYFAPVQAVGDFLADKKGLTNFIVTPTYRPGTINARLSECLPPFVTKTIQNALLAFEQKIRGFASVDVPLTGVEMRTSAPCRITRNPRTFEAVNTKGLYPIGEGAGYAGGIMSAALDGLKAAIAYCNNLSQDISSNNISDV